MKKYICTSAEELADSLIADLGRGEMTVNGDRVSGYFLLARQGDYGTIRAFLDLHPNATLNADTAFGHIHLTPEQGKAALAGKSVPVADPFGTPAPNIPAAEMLDQAIWVLTRDSDNNNLFHAAATYGNKLVTQAGISVSLIENTHNLDGGKPYYGLHIIDDIAGDNCDLQYTDELSRDALVKLLEELIETYTAKEI